MMTKPAVTSFIAPLLAAGASASLPTMVLAVSLAVSPPTISNEFEGQITLTITNLTAGQTVRVDKIADLNGNGGIDAGEPIVQSFTVTDGLLPEIGGVRNLNVPGDEDSVTGKITAKVLYPGTETTIDHIAGTYLYRVSNPTSGLQLATSPLTINQDIGLQQGVTGTITAADNGHPLANIPVALPDMQGKGGVGAFTDANGHYTVYSAPGSSYAVVPVVPGFVADMEASSVTVNAGQFNVKNLTLARGNFTIFGSVSDSAASGTGIPGVFMMGQMGEDCPQCLFAGSFTDSSGNYTLSVNAGQWDIRVDDSDPAVAAGYVGPPEGASLDVTESVANVDFPLSKATALIYGTVQDDQGNPVTGVTVYAEDQNGNDRGAGRAVAPDGRYAVGVVPGSWNVGVDSDELSSLGYAGGQWVTVNVAYDQALLQNFTVQSITAYLQGQLVDTENNGVANVGVYACPGQGGSCTNSRTGADGSFSVGVFNGGWNLNFSSDDLASRGLVGPQFQFTVTQGVNQTGIRAVALPAPRRISGFVRDANGNAIGSLWVYAFATINDRQYNAGGQTDDQGNYTLAVADGDWQVGLNCYGSNSLSSHGLPCVSNKSVHISQNNGTADFVVGTPAETCVGNCGDGDQVTVDEILTMVNIALGNLDISHCLAGDANGDNQITVDEILTAVNNALNGCG